MTTRPLTFSHMSGARPAAGGSGDPRLVELSALSLLWGLVRAMETTPPDALEGLLDALMGMPFDAADVADYARHRHPRRRAGR